MVFFFKECFPSHAQEAHSTSIYVWGAQDWFCSATTFSTLMSTLSRMLIKLERERIKHVFFLFNFKECEKMYVVEVVIFKISDKIISFLCWIVLVLNILYIYIYLFLLFFCTYLFSCYSFLKNCFLDVVKSKELKILTIKIPFLFLQPLQQLFYFFFYFCITLDFFFNYYYLQVYYKRRGTITNINKKVTKIEISPYQIKIHLKIH